MPAFPAAKNADLHYKDSKPFTAEKERSVLTAPWSSTGVLLTPICWQNLGSGFAFHQPCFFLWTIAESGSTFLSSCFHLISTWIHEHKSDLLVWLLCSLFPLSPFLCISWALLMVTWGWDVHLARDPRRTQEVQRGAPEESLKKWIIWKYPGKVWQHRTHHSGLKPKTKFIS